jgi:hypothetical protein
VKKEAGTQRTSRLTPLNYVDGSKKLIHSTSFASIRQRKAISARRNPSNRRQHRTTGSASSIIRSPLIRLSVPRSNTAFSPAFLQ